MSEATLNTWIIILLWNNFMDIFVPIQCYDNCLHWFVLHVHVYISAY